MVFHGSDAAGLIGATRDIVDRRAFTSLLNMLLSFGRAEITTAEKARRLGYNWDASDLPQLQPDEAGSRQRPQRHSGSDAPADLSPARLPGARGAQDLDGHGDAPSARLFEVLRVRRENVGLIGDKGGEAGGARVETVQARVRRRWQKAHDVGAAPDRSCPGHAFFARTVPWPMVIR
jgi:hypothetical protein